MPRYNIIHNNKYMHFSGVVDAPLTNFINIDEYKKYYISEYSEKDYNDFIAGNRNMMDIDEAVEYYNMNREDKLTKEEFLQFYGFYEVNT